MYNKNKLLLIVYSRAPSLLLYGVMSVVNGTHNITCKLYVEEHGLKICRTEWRVSVQRKHGVGRANCNEVNDSIGNISIIVINNWYLSITIWKNM